MNTLKEFLLPVSGLALGIHQFEYHFDEKFLTFFEESPKINEGEFDFNVTFEKQSSMFIFDILLNGKVNSNCDRCTADIKLPVQTEQQFIVKLKADEESHDETGEVIYVSPTIEKFDLSKLLYESICLSIPLIKTYNCENETPSPCDMDVLNKLNSNEESPSDEKSVWADLTEIKNKLKNT